MIITKNPQKIELTNDQQQALLKLKSFVIGKNHFLKLSGYAGTGKSTLICFLMEWLESEGIKFVGASPTNKAAKNLRKLAEKQRIEVEVKTVAQLLGQQPEVDEETGEEKFVAGNGKAQFDRYEVIIIDEYSMINKENFSEIVNEATEAGVQVLFLGDNKQLPPVKEKEPIVASSEIIEEEATLSKIVRYDGEIVHVAEEIRSNPRYNSSIYPFKTTSDRTIVSLSRREWLKSAKEHFCSAEYQNNPDYVRLLVWRNQTANDANNFIRRCLWGKDISMYPVEGDRLIARKPVFRTKPGGKGKNKWRIVLNNSEECTVIDSVQQKYLIIQKQGYEYYSVPVMTEMGVEQTLSWLTDESARIRTEKVKESARKKQWSLYFDLARTFDDVTYSYALTTHKAQGSSIDHVF
ncbi:MAG: AAA family ATPase, partial [Cyanobacteriota bacterium]|nr:AAA family ATPase [Cyanobacteriota bacterium]